MSAEMSTETEMSTGKSTVSVVATLPGDKEVNEDMVIALDVANKVKVYTPPTFANTYAAKKTVAQGMMDIALITSNANQLRYLLEYGSRGSTMFYLAVVFIVMSLLLQLAVGICLIFKGRFDLSGESKTVQANRLNNYVVVAVFLVTVINVFVAAFSISSEVSPAVAAVAVAAAPLPPPPVAPGSAELL